MGLLHEFALISKEANDSFDFVTVKRDELGKILVDDKRVFDVIEMKDDLATYLMDFFNWIPSYGDSKTNKSFGLNYHGITYISNEEGFFFGEIFGMLANLFSVAPETFKLRGDFYWEDDNVDTGKYEFYEFNKVDVIRVLKKMSTWGDRMKKNHNLYIVHMGI